MAEKRRQHEIRLILLLAAACLAVYLAAAAFLLTGNSAEEQDDAALRTAASLTEMEVTGADGSFRMEKNQAEWYCVTKDVPVNSTEVSVMASSFGELTADRIIPQGTACFSQFGLDGDAYQVTVQSQEGKKTWKVGNYNAILDQYYVTVDDGDTIYLVPRQQMEKCMKSLLNLVATPGLTAMNSSEIREYEVRNGTEHYTASKSGDVFRYRADGKMYEGNGYSAEDIFFALKNIACDNCVTYDASESDLRNFGLDQPEIEIRLTMKDDSVFTVKVAEAEDGTGYLNAWDNQIVYHITVRELENLKEKISLKNQLAE